MTTMSTTTTTDTLGPFAVAHERFLSRVGEDARSDLRHAAFDAFKRQGIPTTRHEDWKYTNLKTLATTDYLLPDAPAELTADQIKPFMIEGLDAHLLVFVDGHFAPGLGDDVAQLGDIGVRRLADAQDAVARRLGELVDVDADAFAALNSAFVDDGLLVHVPAGRKIDKPICVLSIATAGDQPKMTHPRNLIVVEDDAQATVIEHYVSMGGEHYLTNAVTEIIAGDGAVAHHYVLEREHETATNISTLFIHQGEKSDVHSHTVLLGGAIVRNNICPTLAGEDAHCLINGLFVGHGEQHLDNAMRVRHSAPNCRSRQFYKGVMDDHSHGVFTGRIIVDNAAQQTDAIQNNRNMLLSDDARMNARPQLEIYADDVRCTHGATTGQVDPEAVFYFRARGLPEDVARAMLVYAFVAEGFDRMQLVPVRALLADELIAKLPMANKLSAEFNQEIKERLYRI